MKNLLITVLAFTSIFFFLDTMSSRERAEMYSGSQNYWRGLYYDLKAQPEHRENLRKVADKDNHQLLDID